MQGFYFSHPLTKQDLSTLLNNGRHLTAENLRQDTIKETLLLVAEDENVLKELEHIFKRDGYHILSTTNPQQALETLEIYSISVIIIDEHLSEMPGTQLLISVKKHDPEIKCILISDHPESQSITDKNIVVSYISKPWESSKLRAHIGEAFKRF